MFVSRAGGFSKRKVREANLVALECEILTEQADAIE